MAPPTDVVFFQTCCSVTFFAGVPANILVLIYLVWGSKDHCSITHTLFTFIVTTDLLFSVTVGTFAIEQISGMTLYSSKNQVFCEIFDYVFNTLSRIIYFWMSLLAVVRARAIRNPLTQITRLAIRCIMVGTIIFFLCLFLVPLIIRRANDKASCGGNLKDTFPDDLIRSLWRGLSTLLPVASTVIVMLGANSISLYHLLRVRGEAVHANRRSIRTKKVAAKTTLVLTIIFFSLHFLGILTTVSQVMNIKIGVSFFYANGLMILSASVDPFVYFLKTPAVWTYWKGVIIKQEFSRLRRYSYRRFHPGGSPFDMSRTTMVMDNFRTVTIRSDIRNKDMVTPSNTPETNSVETPNGKDGEENGLLTVCVKGVGALDRKTSKIEI